MSKGSGFAAKSPYFWVKLRLARWKPIPLDCNCVSTWANLAVAVYHRATNHEDAHLFVTLVSRVFEIMRLRIDVAMPVLDDRVGETIAPMTELLYCVVRALRQSLAHSQLDCGAYIALPWIKDLIRCYEAPENSPWWQHRNWEPLRLILLTSDEAIRPIFLLILRLLETALDCGLLSGDNPSADFDQLLTMLKYPELPPLPSDLGLAASDLDVSAVRLDGSEVSQSCFDQQIWDVHLFQRTGWRTSRS